MLQPPSANTTSNHTDWPKLALWPCFTSRSRKVYASMFPEVDKWILVNINNHTIITCETKNYFHTNMWQRIWNQMYSKNVNCLWARGSTQKRWENSNSIHIQKSHSLNMFPEQRAKVQNNPGTTGWQFYLTFKSLSCLEISSLTLAMHTVKYIHHSLIQYLPSMPRCWRIRRGLHSIGLNKVLWEHRRGSNWFFKIF